MIQKFNGSMEFDFSVTLLNTKTSATFCFIPEHIEQLDIIDDLFSPYHSGMLMVENTNDFIHRTELKDKVLPGGFFEFASDFSDLLLIRMVPVMSKGKVEDEPVYLFDFTFSITNVEDVIIENKKFKKIHFTDRDQVLLTQTMASFSTADYALTLKPKSKLTNQDRAMLTGLAIKELIRATLTKSFVLFKADELNWNRGSSSIFYSSTNEMRASHCLEALMSYHYASGDTFGGLTILKKERHNGFYTFKSLQEYFDGAYKPGLTGDSYGDLNNEHFTIVADAPKDPRSIPPASKTPLDKTSTLNQGSISMISDFVFNTPDATDIGGMLNPRVVHSFSHAAGEWHISSFDSIPELIEEKIGVMYTSKMKGNPFTGARPAVSLATTLNQYHNTFAFAHDRDDKKPFGQNKNIFISMFLSNTMTFSVQGYTNRRSGRFIGIDRAGTYLDNKFDNMLLGQHFVVQVVHTIKRRNYTNTITAIKPYKYS